MSEEIKKCYAVVSGTFCKCGGVMNKTGGLLMSAPPQQKMECPFCGETRVVLATASGTQIQFKAMLDHDNGSDV